MAAEGNEAPATRRWQFSLRGILSFTAWAACTAAFARLRGTGAAVLIVGRRGGKTAYLAWALLLASLFLPAVRGCSNSSIAGWQAAGACAMAQFSMPDPGIEHRWVAYGYYSMLNLANLLLLLSPWALYRARRGKGQCYAAALGICAVAVWSASVDDAGGLLAGYYVWSLAVLGLLSAFPLGPRTMTLMVLAGLGRLFLLPPTH